MKTSAQQRNSQLIKKNTKSTDNKRSSCLTESPVLCSGLNVKGNDEIIVLNFLDSINNNNNSNLITSLALPPSVAKDLYKALGEAINQQENE